MTAAPIAASAPAASFAPTSVNPAPVQADDGTPSFRQVMNKAATQQDASPGKDAKPKDDADQAAQQLAMQALALAGITPPRQLELPKAAIAPAKTAQLDPLSQITALAALGGTGPLGQVGQLGQVAQLGQLAPKAVASPAAQPAAPAPVDDSPVAAMVAAAVSRAVGSLGGGKPATTTAGAVTTDAAASKAAAVLAAAGDTSAPAALTPLEQAVHELIGQISEQAGGKHADKAKLDDSSDDPLGAADDAGDPTASQTALGQLATQPTSIHQLPAASPAAELDPTRPAALHQPPEASSNPSHVHLVLDDGPDRVVVTVAVRGNDIHVALRGSDDATTNALARNAASLDDAMRARGLQLSELTAEREPRQPDSQRQPAEPREQRKPNAERFKLEENL